MGEDLSVTIHPRAHSGAYLEGEMGDRTIHYERERTYPLTVGEAWHQLADTDHLNRAIGLPAIDFSPMDGARGKVVREARSRAFGVVPVQWKEYPFEWVRERSYVVRREFTSPGPIKVIEGGIELSPTEGGVRVRSYADFTPANVTGRLLWRLGADVVDKTADFCDAYIARRAQGAVDPAPTKQRPRVDRAQLARGIDRLRAAPVVSELVHLLERTILEASDDRVHRFRAYSLADLWQKDRGEVLRLLLHAVRAGVLELRWELMCPLCRIGKGGATSLALLPKTYHCDTCGIDYATELDERVELRFTVHPAIRRVEGDTFCIGGPLRAPHIFAQMYLRPGENRKLDVSIDRPLRLRAVGGKRHLRLEPADGSRWSADISVFYADGRWTGPHSLAVGDDALGIPRGGTLWLRNQTQGPLLAVVEDVERTAQATSVAEVVTLGEFRDLFGGEMLAPGQEIAVREAVLLASRRVARRSLFARDDGDADQDTHRALVARVADGRRGSVVRVTTDVVVATFCSVADARAAADELTRGGGATALHLGPVTACNGEDGLEYYGRAVDTVIARAREAQPGELREPTVA